MSNDDTTPWRKASASSNDGNCVELRRSNGMVEVRDTKDRDGGTLRFTRAEFAAWLDGARAGEFDNLA